MNPVELGKRLRTMREERGLDQTALATATGIWQSQISRLERGGTERPNVYDLQKIAAFYGICLDALLGDEAPAPRPWDEVRAEVIRQATAILDAVGKTTPANSTIDEKPPANGKRSANKSETDPATLLCLPLTGR